MPEAKKPAIIGLIEKLIWPAAIVAAVAFAPWDRIIPGIDPAPAPAPVVNGDMEDVREVAAKGSASERKQMGDFLCALACTLERVNSAPAQAVRSFLDDAETFRIGGTDLAGSFPGFGDVRKKYFGKAIGDSDRTLSKSDIGKLAKISHEMSEVFLNE